MEGTVTSALVEATKNEEEKGGAKIAALVDGGHMINPIEQVRTSFNHVHSRSNKSTLLAQTNS